MKQYSKPRKSHALFSLGFAETISPRLGFLSWVFLANHLASNDNLTIQQPKDRTHSNKN